jgi:hypothetical protein
MSSKNYIEGRRKYQRPQGLLFSDNPGYLDDGFYVPTGSERNNDFIILSDDNRGPIDFRTNRIESRKRMINGRMRSYHIADKVSISCNWDMLASRSASIRERFEETTGQSILPDNETSYTSDRGAGGVDILDWYNNHQGSFWVFLAYDNFKNFSTTSDELEIIDDYSKMGRYNEIVEVFFDSFDYSVVSRGGSTHDFWNISFTLEEV